MVFTMVLLALFFATFVPAVVHARRGSRLFDGEASWRRMKPKARADTVGRWVLMPQSPEAVRRERQRRTLRLRRRILLGLVALALISGAAGAWLGPWAGVWAVHAGADVLVVAFVLYLVRSREMRDRAVATVSPLTDARRSEEVEATPQSASAAGDHLGRA